jgi:hypothetical protein
MCPKPIKSDIQPNMLYKLTVSEKQSAYELLATSSDDLRTVCGRWEFKSVEQMTLALSRLDMSAIDYIGVDRRLETASSVSVGHAIKGSILLDVLGTTQSFD